MSSHSEQMRYVRATLNGEEIARRVADLINADDAHKQFMHWDSGRMTPAQLITWATFARDMGADRVDSYSASRPMTDAELVEKVIQQEHYRRSYTTNDMPEDLSDPEGAAALYLEEQADLHRDLTAI